MKILTGVDLIYLPRFKKSLNSGGEKFLQRVFLETELEDPTRIEHLAGIFAAKEAVMKALDLPKGSWLNIQIRNTKEGSPQVQLLTSHFSLLTSSVSISHDGNYVIAQFVGILKEDATG